MHTVEVLDEALDAAKRLGYQLRQEWLEGRGGDVCVIQGRKWLFLDLAQTPDEQLGQVVYFLRADPKVREIPLGETLRQLLFD